jgi:hypothetical protein
MKHNRIIFRMIILMVSCSSCEKVIDVKLNGSTAQVVIEGEISTVRGPYRVSVTESRNFEDNNTFSGREDALVVIKDMTSGSSETLRSVGSGIYQTVSLQGTGGHTYQLTVTLGGKIYTASSTIPGRAVRLERLFAERSSIDSEDVYMVPVYTDPVGKGNYYRIKQWVRNLPVKGSYARSDEATDGRIFDSLLYYDTDAKAGNPLIKNGDVISAELQCVDKAVYDFYRTLNATVSQETATPANPLTNFSGGALGVFNACRSSKLTAVAKYE